MQRIEKNSKKIAQLENLLSNQNIPAIDEADTHLFETTQDQRTLENLYFLIVAICHQTSPIGEKRLQGYINGKLKFGWDYLKEKTLTQEPTKLNLSNPECWQNLKPSELSNFFHDSKKGLTLNRINERCYLINDLGRKFADMSVSNVFELYKSEKRELTVKDILAKLSIFEAYSDPVQKKSLFFLSIMVNTCGWSFNTNVSSPVDYHELRGHLRIGTVGINDKKLHQKLLLNIPLTQSEDIELRSVVQKINNLLADKLNITPDQLHYLLWNIFRNCCPSNTETHCRKCGEKCKLPEKYSMISKADKCFFSDICSSSSKKDKFREPAYFGHFY